MVTSAAEMYFGPTVSATNEIGSTQHPCNAIHGMSAVNRAPGLAPHTSAMTQQIADCSGNSAGNCASGTTTLARRSMVKLTERPMAHMSASSSPTSSSEETASSPLLTRLNED